MPAPAATKFQGKEPAIQSKHANSPSDSSTAAKPARPIAAILGLTVFAHGLLIPWLGFYWDDMPKSWFLHLLGPMGFWKVYQVDRPFLPWIYMLTTPVIGESPPGWQLLELLARGITAIGLWWVVCLIWPRRRGLALLTGLFFVVYPGFLQGPISLIYSHYFLLYALFLASLGCSVKALRNPARRGLWTGAAITALALVLFSFEYLVGLELVRPLVIGFVLRQSGPRGRRLLTRTVRLWAPYAVVFIVYLLWRSLVVQFPTYEPELFVGLAVAPVAKLGGLLTRVGIDLYLGSIGSWLNALRPPDLSIVGRAGLAAMGLAGVGALAVVLWGLLPYRTPSARPADGDPRADLAEAAALGGWSLIVAGMPVWTTLLPLRLVFPWDRLTLPFMLGASLLAAAGLLLLFRDRLAGIGVAAILLSLGAAFHASNAMAFVRDWDRYASFISQLTERVPGLEPGTSLLMDDIPLTYSTDNSLTAPVNWAYAPNLKSTHMPYLVVSIPMRLGGSLTSLQPGTPITRIYRATDFAGSTSQAIVVFYEPYDCLQVLDPELHAGMPTLDPDLAAALPLSRLGLIDTAADPPAHPPFSQKTDANWCTLFQQADLARQRGDWQRVAALGDLGLNSPDEPNHGSEYLPFIEGYGQVGRWQEALAWSQTALERNPEISQMLCHTWERLERSAPDGPGRPEAVDSVQHSAGCSSPSP